MFITKSSTLQHFTSVWSNFICDWSSNLNLLLVKTLNSSFFFAQNRKRDSVLHSPFCVSSSSGHIQEKVNMENIRNAMPCMCEDRVLRQN